MKPLLTCFICDQETVFVKKSIRGPDQNIDCWEFKCESKDHEFTYEFAHNKIGNARMDNFGPMIIQVEMNPFMEGKFVLYFGYKANNRGFGIPIAKFKTDYNHVEEARLDCKHLLANFSEELFI